MRLVKIFGGIIAFLVVIYLIGNSQGWFGGGKGIVVNTDTA